MGRDRVDLGLYGGVIRRGYSEVLYGGLIRRGDSEVLYGGLIRRGDTEGLYGGLIRRVLCKLGWASRLVGCGLVGCRLTSHKLFGGAHRSVTSD